MCWNTANKDRVMRAGPQQKRKWGRLGLGAHSSETDTSAEQQQDPESLIFMKIRFSGALLLFGQLPSAVFAVLHVSYYCQMEKVCCAVYPIKVSSRK